MFSQKVLEKNKDNKNDSKDIEDSMFKSIFIDNFEKYRKFQTTGDGNCGIHAILGEIDQDQRKYYYHDSNKLRLEVASHYIYNTDDKINSSSTIHQKEIVNRCIMEFIRIKHNDDSLSLLLENHNYRCKEVDHKVMNFRFKITCKNELEIDDLEVFFSMCSEFSKPSESVKRFTNTYHTTVDSFLKHHISWEEVLDILPQDPKEIANIFCENVSIFYKARKISSVKELENELTNNNKVRKAYFDIFIKQSYFLSTEELQLFAEFSNIHAFIIYEDNGSRLYRELSTESPNKETKEVVIFHEGNHFSRMTLPNETQGNFNLTPKNKRVRGSPQREKLTKTTPSPNEKKRLKTGVDLNPSISKEMNSVTFQVEEEDLDSLLSSSTELEDSQNETKASFEELPLESSEEGEIQYNYPSMSTSWEDKTPSEAHLKKSKQKSKENANNANKPLNYSNLMKNQEPKEQIPFVDNTTYLKLSIGTDPKCSFEFELFKINIKMICFQHKIHVSEHFQNSAIHNQQKKGRDLYYPMKDLDEAERLRISFNDKLFTLNGTKKLKAEIMNKDHFENERITGLKTFAIKVQNKIGKQAEMDNLKEKLIKSPGFVSITEPKENMLTYTFRFSIVNSFIVDSWYRNDPNRRNHATMNGFIFECSDKRTRCKECKCIGHSSECCSESLRDAVKIHGNGLHNKHNLIRGMSNEYKIFYRQSGIIEVISNTFDEKGNKLEAKRIQRYYKGTGPISYSCANSISTSPEQDLGKDKPKETITNNSQSTSPSLNKEDNNTSSINDPAKGDPSKLEMISSIKDIIEETMKNKKIYQASSITNSFHETWRELNKQQKIFMSKKNEIINPLEWEEISKSVAFTTFKDWNITYNNRNRFKNFFQIFLTSFPNQNFTKTESLEEMKERLTKESITMDEWDDNKRNEMTILFAKIFEYTTYDENEHPGSGLASSGEKSSLENKCSEQTCQE